MDTKLLKRRNLILSGNILKAIIFLAVPVAINEFIFAAYNLMDMLFVANIGDLEIAAITFVTPINTIVRSISLGLSIGSTNIIAREIGKGNYDKAKLALLKILYIAISIGLILTFFGFTFSANILRSASATESILSTANQYYKLTMLSAPFVFINAIYLSLKRADGNTLKVMVVNIIGMSVKAILTYILIFHLHFGVTALAIGTIAGTFIVSLYGLYDMFIKKSLMQLSFSLHEKDFNIILTLMLISIPVIIEKTSMSFGFIVMNKYIIPFGENVLSGYGITNRINSLFFSTVTGFATGLSPIISQNLGAGQENRAREAIKKTFILAICISTTISLIILPLRPFIAKFFVAGNAEIMQHTINAMGVYSASVIPYAIFQVTCGVFQGTGHTKYSMLISLIRIYCLRIPLVIVLSRFTPLNEYSIWISMLVSNIITGIIALFLYLRSKDSLQLIGEK